MMKLLIVSITYHTSQNRVGDTITHVTLNNINCAVLHKSASTRECPPLHMPRWRGSLWKLRNKMVCGCSSVRFYVLQDLPIKRTPKICVALANL